VREAVILWSSGKDAAHALWEVSRSEELRVVGAVTTIESKSGRVAFHGASRALVAHQIAGLALPWGVAELPSPCPNERWERELGRALAPFAERGADLVVSGDLHLDDVRAFRERALARLGFELRCPLWGRETAPLAAAMLDAGLEARVTCVERAALPASLVGRRFDRDFLDALPAGVDPCGERGEFHTFVEASPLMRGRVATRVARVADGGRFATAELEVP
jgi:uncharacterized protein (TIGR00290 family)